jgi:hypothetical protein
MEDKTKVSIQAPEETKLEVGTTPWVLKVIIFIKKDKAKAEAQEQAQTTVNS